MRAAWLVSFALLGFGCGKAPAPDRVELTLAPDLISSQSGLLGARAAVFDGDTPLSDWAVHLTVDYADRNGAAHPITDVAASADTGGDVLASFTGLTWQGEGKITATVLDAQGQPALDAKKQPVVTTATFAVLDETPPTATLTAPMDGQHLPKGNYNVTVAVADEIGVSQIYVQAVNQRDGGNQDRTRSVITASGTTSGSQTFEFSSENANVGDTIKLYAMAADMSGNLAVASPISIVVDAAP